MDRLPRFLPGRDGFVFPDKPAHFLDRPIGIVAMFKQIPQYFRPAGSNGELKRIIRIDLRVDDAWIRFQNARHSFQVTQATRGVKIQCSTQAQ